MRLDHVSRNEIEEWMKADVYVCHVTFPSSVIWTGFSLWRTSFPFCDAAPLRCLPKASRAPYPNSAAGPQTGCAIWPSCPGPSAVPVLRRSGLFQENSVTKRVSMPVLEQASLRWLIRTAPTTPFSSTSLSSQPPRSHLLKTSTYHSYRICFGTNTVFTK